MPRDVQTSSQGFRGYGRVATRRGRRRASLNHWRFLLLLLGFTRRRHAKWVTNTKKNENHSTHSSVQIFTQIPLFSKLLTLCCSINSFPQSVIDVVPVNLSIVNLSPHNRGYHKLTSKINDLTLSSGNSTRARGPQLH